MLSVGNSWLHTVYKFDIIEAPSDIILGGLCVEPVETAVFY
jgi:hypothetical protein